MAYDTDDPNNKNYFQEIIDFISNNQVKIIIGVSSISAIAYGAAIIYKAISDKYNYQYQLNKYNYAIDTLKESMQQINEILNPKSNLITEINNEGFIANNILEGKVADQEAFKIQSLESLPNIRSALIEAALYTAAGIFGLISLTYDNDLT